MQPILSRNQFKSLLHEFRKTGKVPAGCEYDPSTPPPAKQLARFLGPISTYGRTRWVAILDRYTGKRRDQIFETPV